MFDSVFLLYVNRCIELFAKRIFNSTYYLYVRFEMDVECQL